MVPMVHKRRMTEDEYFQLLETTGERLEFQAGIVEGMAGASPEHNDIESQLMSAFLLRLQGSDCTLLTPNQALYVSARNSFYFADLSVVCGAPERVMRRGIGCLTNPVVVVEVLSATTWTKDEGDKFFAYTTLKSLRTYLIVFSDRYCVKLHERTNSDEIWRTSIYTGLDEEFEIKSCAIRLKVRDVYGPRIQFEPQ